MASYSDINTYLFTIRCALRTSIPMCRPVGTAPLQLNNSSRLIVHCENVAILTLSSQWKCQRVHKLCDTRVDSAVVPRGMFSSVSASEVDCHLVPHSKFFHAINNLTRNGTRVKICLD